MTCMFFLVVQFTCIYIQSLNQLVIIHFDSFQYMQSVIMDNTTIKARFKQIICDFFKVCT